MVNETKLRRHCLLAQLNYGFSFKQQKTSYNCGEGDTLEDRTPGYPLDIHLDLSMETFTLQESQPSSLTHGPGATMYWGLKYPKNALYVTVLN